MSDSFDLRALAGPPIPLRGLTVGERESFRAVPAIGAIGAKPSNIIVDVCESIGNFDDAFEEESHCYCSERTLGHIEEKKSLHRYRCLIFPFLVLLIHMVSTSSNTAFSAFSTAI